MKGTLHVLLALTILGASPGVVCGTASAAQPRAVAQGGLLASRDGSPVQLDARQAILSFADSCVGWTEKTGNNDGPNIDRILDSVGIKGTRNPYCAAFVYFCGVESGHPVYPRSAWSPDMVLNPTWTRAKGGREPQPCDAFGIYFSAKGRVAHTGLVRKVFGNIFETIEGNTSPEATPGSAADRNGDGVWKKRRLRSQIFATRDWVSNPAK